jgi:hypothetical protein
MCDTIVGQIVERDKITEAEAMSQIDASILLRRSNTGDDIASTAVFLASEEARMSPANRVERRWRTGVGLNDAAHCG